MRGSMMMRRPPFRPFGGCPPPFSPPPPMARPPIRCPPMFMPPGPFRRPRLPPPQTFFPPMPPIPRPPFQRHGMPNEMVMHPRRMPKASFHPYHPGNRGQQWKNAKKIASQKKTNFSNGHVTVKSETPKTKDSASVQEALAELKVPQDMMQPLYCKLCDAKLNGTLQANAHYEGKNHLKKERQYLEQLRIEKGIEAPLPVTNGKTEKKALEEEYCKLCDVAFTSEIQAKQHYLGRNHQRRSCGEAPLPKGFFNAMTGRWQRQPPSGASRKISSQQYNIVQANISTPLQMQSDIQFISAKQIVVESKKDQ